MVDRISAQRTLADAKTLLISIELDWTDVANRPMSDVVRKGCHQHMLWAMTELAGLFKQLEKEVVGAK
jgi:hypothetical protein